VSNRESSSATLLTSDKHRIAYRHYKAGHRQAVIIAHGFFNSKDALLLLKFKDELIKDFDVIMFDFRGHGQSSGLFCWTAKENLDLEAVMEYAKKYYSVIGLIGFSFGAAVSIRVAAQKGGIKSLICVSAPTEIKKIDYRFWDLDLENDIIFNLKLARKAKTNKFGVRPGPFWLKKPRPIALVEKVACPILFIHGEKDWVTACWHSKKLFEKARGTKDLRILKNGPHSEYIFRDRKNWRESISLIRDWFITTFPEGGRI
jgi:uncharacterized protein